MSGRPEFQYLHRSASGCPRTTDARRPRTLGISLFAHRDERMPARHLQRHGLLQRQARAPSFRNFKQPRSHRPHRRMLSEYGHRGGHLRTCKLYQDRRYEDDERHRRFGRLHQQCLFEHFHLRFHHQGRSHQQHRAVLFPYRPYEPFRGCRHHGIRRGRPAWKMRHGESSRACQGSPSRLSSAFARLHEVPTTACRLHSPCTTLICARETCD